VVFRHINGVAIFCCTVFYFDNLDIIKMMSW
jgi:hypothetical protein